MAGDTFPVSRARRKWRTALPGRSRTRMLEAPMRIAMTAVRALAVAAPLLMACAAHAGLPTGDFTDDPAASGLSSPTALAFLPDGRFLVTEKDGGIKLVTDGVVTPAGSMAVCTDSEMGLLGIALHPSFATNGILYLYRTEAAGGCASATHGSATSKAPASTMRIAAAPLIRRPNFRHD
jgi:glucose/arabinose dehydrogenase